jgi:cytoskeleton protein RodZ
VTNQTQATDQDDQNVVDFSESPGRRLRVQRQSRGITIERVATQLHLRHEIIEALEQDRFEALPGAVFVTGYLRNYAKLIGLDPAPLIAAYQAQAGSPESDLGSTGPLRHSAPDSRGARILVRLVSLALIAALIGMIALWWHDRTEIERDLVLETETPGLEMDSNDLVDRPTDVTETAAEPMLDRAPSLSDSGIGSDRTDSDTRAAPMIVAEPISPPETLPTPEPAPRAAQASTDPVVTTAPPGEALPDIAIEAGGETDSLAETSTADAPKGIRLEFIGPSWLEVRDSAGIRLIVGEMGAGDQREVKGQPPFRFTIGRVSNTRMTIDGEPFDLEGRARGNVARFSFDPASPE